MARDRALFNELGNLTLVTQRLNSKVSNGSWATKVKHFHQAENDVLLTNDVIQHAPIMWDESLIATRTARLTASILDVWPVPAGHVGLAPSASGPNTSGEVDVALLVSEGLISAGAKLTARPVVLNGAAAAVGQDGRIFVAGTGYETPSAAGVAANAEGLYKGGINGWRFWRLVDSGRSLWDVRNEYRASIGEDSVADEAGEEAKVSEQIEAELVLAELNNGNRRYRQPRTTRADVAEPCRSVHGSS